MKIRIVGKKESGRKTAKSIIENNFPTIDCEVIENSEDGVAELIEEVNNDNSLAIVEIERSTLYRLASIYKFCYIDLKHFKEIEEERQYYFNILTSIKTHQVENNDSINDLKIQVVSLIKKIRRGEKKCKKN